MLTQLVVWLNALAGGIAGVALAPVAWLPGWLSATAIAVATGIAMLYVFKHTSNQSAIQRTRNRIRANLLALSLFKDDLRVGLRCQGELLLGAVRLLTLSFVPMLVMLAPMCLLLGQLSLWYQARPLGVGEETVVTVRLADREGQPVPEVRLTDSSSFELGAGPVRVPGKHLICWSIVAKEPGIHHLTFGVDEQIVTKQLAVGDGFLPTSLKRPGWNVTDVLLHPRETPFRAESPVQSIEVEFPERLSWTSGSRSWLAYWFLVSMAAGFAARPLLNVKI